MYLLNVGLANRTAQVRPSLKRPRREVLRRQEDPPRTHEAGQHLTTTEVFLGLGDAGRPSCTAKTHRRYRRYVNIPSGNSQLLSEKFLTFVNPVFPARVEHTKRLPAWRFAEARTENNIDPTHPASWRSPRSERSNEFPGFSSRPGRTARRSRALGRRRARRRARFGGSLDGRIAATAVPPLPVRQHHALGRRARLSPLPLRFLQAHIQYPDQDTPREVAQQGTLADLRRDDDRAKEHPQKRGGVRGERDDLVPLAQALPGMLLCSARKNNR